MSIFKYCMTKSRLATILGVLWLLVLAIVIPVAIAEEEHTWDRQKEREKQLDEEFRHNQFSRELQDRYRSPAAPTFSAIAYSKSTDKWGYSWGKASREQAEQYAIKQCGVPGAEVLCWSKGSWFCALAQGPGTHGAAAGASLRIAEAEALKIANRNGHGSKIVFFVRGNSHGVLVSEWKPDGTASIDSPNQINLFTVAPPHRH